MATYANANARYGANSDEYGHALRDNTELVRRHTDFRLPIMHRLGGWLCCVAMLAVFMGVIQQWVAKIPILYYRDTETASLAVVISTATLFIGLLRSDPRDIFKGGVYVIIATILVGSSIRLGYDEYADCQALHDDPVTLNQARNEFAAQLRAMSTASAESLAAATQSLFPQISVMTRSGGPCAGVQFSDSVYRLQQALMMIHGIVMLLCCLLLSVAYLAGFTHLLRWLRVREEIEVYVYEDLLSRDTGRLRHLLQEQDTEQRKLERTLSSSTK
jgi:hypothetical protein